MGMSPAWGVTTTEINLLKRKDSLVRRTATLLVALAGLMASAAPGASASPVTFPADAGFTAGSSWTASTTGCALLCTVSGDQPATGGNPGGRAVAHFTTVANVLGLASGAVDFTS